MQTSPAGRIGTRSIDGTPHGSSRKIVETNVPANVDPSTAFDPSSVPTVIFEGAQAGRFYRIRAVCPDDDCWKSGGYAWHGPDGVVPPNVIPFNPYVGINQGALVAKMPGTTRFVFIDHEAVTLYATYSGNIIGGYADFLYSDNEGYMPVVVEELRGGPPNGIVDVLKTVTVEGTGGLFPEGAPTTTSGTKTFYIDIDEDGIVNLVDSVYLEGLSHNFISDIRVELIAPSGQRATVIERIGVGTIKADGAFSGDYEFTDTAMSPITFSNGDLEPGAYRSHEFMSPRMAGAELTGRWKLRFTDLSKGNTGSLTAWRLTLQVAARDRGLFVDPGPAPQILITGFETRDSTFSFSSTDEGTWSNVMPSDPVFFPIMVTRPGTVQKLLDVRLLDFYGFWAGGFHLVLVAPSGKSVTVFHRPGSTGGSAGNTDSFDFGDYIFEDTGTLLPDSGTIPPGTYGRDPGDWPGVTVPAGTYADFVGERTDGEWTLVFYTWDFNSSGGISYGASLSFEYLPD